MGFDSPLSYTLCRCLRSDKADVKCNLTAWVGFSSTSMIEYTTSKSLVNQSPASFPPWSLIFCYLHLTTVTHVGLYSPLLLNSSCFALPSHPSPALAQVFASFWVTTSEVFWKECICRDWKRVRGTRDTVIFLWRWHILSAKEEDDTFLPL